MKRWRVVALLVPLSALIVLGASQTASLPRAGEAGAELTCVQSIKAFHFSLSELERARVSALMVRLAPEVSLTQLRFSPEPEEILQGYHGVIELRYARGALQRANALTIELCGASPAHEVREARWIVRELGRPIAKMVDADSLSWEWVEGGIQSVPGTQLVVEKLACPGAALVQPYQLISENEPLCVKDPQALARIQAEMDALQRERESFTGKLKALLFGDQDYERRVIELSAEMQRLYVYAPSSGVVLEVSPDEGNGFAWIRLQVEESPMQDVRVAP
jgi:hypothetical protein